MKYSTKEMENMEKEQTKAFIQCIKTLNEQEKAGLLMMTDGLMIIAQKKKTAN